MTTDVSFYFDRNDNLCLGSLSIHEFVNDYISSTEDQNDSEFDLATNELIKGKTKLSTPLFLYSKNKLISNFFKYKNSFHDTITIKCGNPTFISYSLKANFNPTILKLFYENGSWCSLVNKNELKLALKTGFTGNRLIFNGNGKTFEEIEMAIRNDCYLNIDSHFNLKHTIKVCQHLESQNDNRNFPVRLLVRLNQSIDASVHGYLSTSIKSCKFGVEENQLDEIIETLLKYPNLVKLVGFHSHLGSTIESVVYYDKSIQNLISIIKHVRERFKISTLDTINLGGGLGINYKKYIDRTSQSTDCKDRQTYPSPSDIALTISKYAQELKGFKIIVEPGRSLVGNAAILITRLIGIKKKGEHNFMVVDSSMCQVIRPCLYEAYHHIEYIKPLRDFCSVEKKLVDIVGPVCESGDFLGKNRVMELPLEESRDENIYLAIMDVGAYCSSMSMNYNLHAKPCEIMVEELDCSNFKFYMTRKSQSLNDILNSYL